MSEKRPARILIVEDHAEMLQVLRKFLTEKGYEILEADTGEAALDMVKSEKPDIILLDIMLPGISGVEVTKELRTNNANGQYIPILMLTAKSEIKDVIAGLEIGADDYIIKPFSFEELIARINSAIRIKNLNENLRAQSIELESANQKIYQLNQTLIEKNKELRKKIYDLRNIFDVSLELHSILDVERLINSSLLTMIGKFSCKSALFMHAIKKNEQRLSVQNSKGFYKSEVENLILEKSDPLVHYLYENQKPVPMDQLPDEALTSAGTQALREINIELVSPIKILHNRFRSINLFGATCQQ